MFILIYNLPTLRRTRLSIDLMKENDLTLILPEADHIPLRENRIHVFEIRCAITPLNDEPLKLVDQFIRLASKISSTESDINIITGKAWTVINRLSEFKLCEKIQR